MSLEIEMEGPWGGAATFVGHNQKGSRLKSETPEINGVLPDPPLLLGYATARTGAGYRLLVFVTLQKLKWWSDFACYRSVTVSRGLLTLITRTYRRAAVLFEFARIVVFDVRVDANVRERTLQRRPGSRSSRVERQCFCPLEHLYSRL
jgi:hypothetical protein